MRKHKAHTFLNLMSLSVGLASFIFIFIYIKGELSYDKFHEDSDRVHRVVIDLLESDGKVLPDATTPPALAYALKNDLPEVEATVRLFPNWGNKFLIGATEDKKFYEEGMIRTDSTFFEVFSFPFLHGDPSNALDAPDKMVITRSAALKYFNKENAIGETLTIYGQENQVKRISGVIEDVPINSHFKFDFLSRLDFGNIDQNWGFWNFYTYVKLGKGSGLEEFQSKLAPFYKTARPEQERYAPIYAQRLTDIHLTSNLKWELEANGSKDNIYIFGALALFVLLISCINYLNLTVADSLRRLKEVGVRKVFGAHKKSLISQFLIEALVTVLIAVIAGGILAEVLFKNLGDVLGREVSILQIENLKVFAGIAFIGLLFGIMAGLYPALHMSSFKVSNAVKGVVGSQGRSAKGLRKTLLVVQFAISTFMIVGTLVVFKQLKHVQNIDLGFSSEQVLVIENAQVTGNQKTFKSELAKLPNVSGVGASSGIVGGLNWTTTLGYPDGVLLNFVITEPEFIDVMDFEFVAGRNFSREFATDASGTNIIVNEQGLKELGLTLEDVGKSVPMSIQNDTIQNGVILGVVKDFHFANFKSEIKPFGFYFRDRTEGNLGVKFSTTNLTETLAQIESVWYEVANGAPFEHYFLDENFATLNAQESKLSSILLYLTALAVFIAFMGMFAMANMTIKDRLKEIAIRKVLGASVSGVSKMITQRFLILVLLANAIAIPLAYYMMQQWLEGFAYRTNIGFMMFVLALASTLGVAWITVGYQSMRAAIINPIKNLRQD